MVPNKLEPDPHKYIHGRQALLFGELRGEEPLITTTHVKIRQPHNNKKKDALI